MRDQIELYEFHKQTCDTKLKNLSKELHDSIVVRNNYYTILCTYKSSLSNAGISFVSIDNIYTGVTQTKIIIKRNLKIFENEEVNNNIIALLKYFMYICTEKLKELNHLLDIYSHVISIPYWEYVKIVREYNNACAVHMMKGNVVTFPNRIGKFGVQFVKLAKDSKIINWKESNIYKRYLLANNLTPKNIHNPDGEEWLIYFTTDYYIRWVWRRMSTSVANAYYYFFQASSYYNSITVDDLESKLETKEEIINSRDMGNLQKSLMLARKFEDIKELYYYGI